MNQKWRDMFIAFLPAIYFMQLVTLLIVLNMEFSKK